MPMLKMSGDLLQFFIRNIYIQMTVFKSHPVIKTEDRHGREMSRKYRTSFVHMKLVLLKKYLWVFSVSGRPYIFLSRNLSSSIMRKGSVLQTLSAMAPKRRLSHARNDIFHTSLVPTLLQNGLPHKMGVHDTKCASHWAGWRGGTLSFYHMKQTASPETLCQDIYDQNFSFSTTPFSK
jgi:hypothetical protein